MARREELSDEHWSVIEPLFDKTESVQTRERPRREDREVMNGVLKISVEYWFALIVRRRII